MEQYLNKIFNEDCLEFMKKLPDKCVDLVLTDPPYGIGADKKKAHSSIRDNPEWADVSWDKRPDKKYFEEMLRVGKIVVVWGGNYFTDMLPVSSGWLCWRKPQAESGFSLADGELAWTSEEFSFRMISLNRESDGIHPTQKPIALMKWCLGFFPEVQTVFDPFLGSGTTAVACKQLKRNYIGCEILKEYCDIAEKRLNACTQLLF